MQIAEHNAVNIGRLFARQNVPTVYGKQQNDTAVAKESGVVGAQDRVELSSYAPKPLSASLFQNAWETGQTLGSGGKLSSEQTERIREDRVFAAIAAMTLQGANGSDTDANIGWPGGIPRPSDAEMEEARRRLSQRFQRMEAMEDPDAVQKNRLDLLEQLANRDNLAMAAAG